MERQIYFSEKPEPQEWGETRIVPLNITETESVEGGVRKIGYRADLVAKVEPPLTVDSIVDAAINSEYTEEDRKRILRHMARKDDAEVIAFNTFVAEIRKAAEAAGYE